MSEARSAIEQTARHINETRIALTQAAVLLVWVWLHNHKSGLRRIAVDLT